MRKLVLIILLFTGLTGFKPNSSHRISGTVYDSADSSAIPGVSVVLKGTGFGTQTDAKGNYSIIVPDDNAVLTFSFIGYTTQDVKAGKGKVLKIYLHATSNQLNEVVVTSYGIQKRKDLTGSVSSISAKSYKAKGLSGKASGLVAADKVSAIYGYSANADFKMQAPAPVITDESYKGIEENGFKAVSAEPLSTFSVDVDAASYSNVRRFINNGQLPPADAVRIEEMINYFTYNLPGPTDGGPVAIHTELSAAPWNSKHRLLRIGLKARTIATEKLPASNLVFLIDVSGSMNEANKLPLVQSSLKMLVNQLRPQDKVSLVVYAGAAGVVLPATGGDKKETINNAIDNLSAGGSTAGGQGIKLAYQIAKQNIMKNGNNRVVLATDGDFNVGASSDDDMQKLIERERESGISLSVLGFGMGNYKDSKMETLADKGNGNYAYIDNITEARKTLVSEFGGTLFTIAKDVKLQVEFNPAKVQAYRLVGYENRVLAKEDFNDDKKDAGDMGSGHTVTAFYEIVPAGIKDDYSASVDPLKYQKPKPVAYSNASDEMMTIKFRYKEPASLKSKLSQVTVKDEPINLKSTSTDFRFAAAVAEIGMLLRDSKFKQNSGYEQAIKMARSAKGEDTEGYRAEFIKLAESARLLSKTELAAQEDNNVDE
ncbi:von Willebrand factor type A domain-containing protein [Mucilaginibacter sp. KACC 22773]|uniref:vWA domain-containing protein n=1 Tax=Mucilaginibacter sp. KACC 22773 TaxID=3025671 RepID=UPI0023671659|nr:von Willebrand factor type A domain-containing protein [Mucilaginibacter sp. KACC 22773]WDF77449.1 von Willebrand factor type A domain-containing protein [Mucilaginibacter sp. KACC 22773]